MGDDFIADEIDRAIVEQLRLNGRATNQQIADRLELTAATVSARIRRMEDENKLRVVAVSDFSAHGYNVLMEVAIEVRATVVETIQTKRAYITGRMEVINMQTGNLSYSKNMVLDDCFTQTGLNYFGDERALDGRQRNRIPLVNCPDDLDMMMRVVDKAKNAFLYEVKNISYL